RLAAVDEAPLQDRQRGRLGAGGGVVEGVKDGGRFGGGTAARGGLGRAVVQELLQGDTQDVGCAHQHGQARVLLAFAAFEVLHPAFRLAHVAAEVGLGVAAPVAPVGDAAADASVHVSPR